MTEPRKIQISVPEGYDTLSQILFRALDQAASGKGKERHSSGEPFEQQPICQISRWVGLGFPLGQAIKKIQESLRLLDIKGPEAAIAELLGAINFTAAAVLVIEERAILTRAPFCLECMNRPCICKPQQSCFCGTELDMRGYCPKHGINTKVLPE